MSMKYQFIAEFYQDIHSEKQVYKTHLWVWKMLNTSSRNTASQRSRRSSWQASKPCRKAVVYAYPADEDSETWLKFGVEQAHWARFSGNSRD